MGLFEDSESGIDSYAWSIGSSQRFSDVMEYTTTLDECAETPSNDPVIQQHLTNVQRHRAMIL